MDESDDIPQLTGDGSPLLPDNRQPRREEVAPIDIQLLADKVYRLLQAEARLAKARGQSTLGRG